MTEKDRPRRETLREKLKDLRQTEEIEFVDAPGAYKKQEDESKPDEPHEEPERD